MFDIFTSQSAWILILLGVAAGFVLIIFGGDFFVDSAVWLAEITKIPKMIIGATVVSIGTTLPEIFVSFTAAAAGQTAMAIGNAAGSIFCNLALILGLTLAAKSAIIDKKEFLPKFVIFIASALLLLFFALNSKIGIAESAILLAVFFVFMFINVYGAVKQNNKLAAQMTNADGNAAQTQQTEDNKKKKPAWLMVVLFFVGAAGIAVGANLLIDSVSAAAAKLSVSEQIISLTVVALGTSLPELITAITSLKKSNAEISMGNVLGANILNATLITGGSGLIAGGLTVAAGDFLPLMISVGLVLVTAAVLIVPVLIKGKTARWQGFTMMSLYLGYTVAMVLNACGIF